MYFYKVVQLNGIPSPTRTLNCGHTAVMGIGGDSVCKLDGYEICMACAGEWEAAELPYLTRIVQYITGEGVFTAPGHRLTTWGGRDIGRVVSAGRVQHTPTGGRWQAVRVRDVHGGEWVGRTPVDSGNYVSLRRAK